MQIEYVNTYLQSWPKQKQPDGELPKLCLMSLRTLLRDNRINLLHYVRVHTITGHCSGVMECVLT